MRRPQRGEATRCDGVDAPWKPPAFRPTWLQLPPDEPLQFQPIEGRVQRTARQAPIRFAFELPRDRHSVRLGLESQDSQQNQLFEFAQRCRDSHEVYFVDIRR